MNKWGLWTCNHQTPVSKNQFYEYFPYYQAYRHITLFIDSTYFNEVNLTSHGCYWNKLHKFNLKDLCCVLLELANIQEKSSYKRFQFQSSAHDNISIY